MNRREFLRLSFGALVASKLPALPATPDPLFVTGDEVIQRWTFDPATLGALDEATFWSAIIDPKYLTLPTSIAPPTPWASIRIGQPVDFERELL